MKEFKYKQRGYSNFQPLAVHECIEIPRGVGVDINYQRVAGGLSSYLKSIQFAPRPRVESNSIDFSQSLTQILASLGHNLNTNPKEGFDVISVCTDTWKETMTVWHKRQEERIFGLEHQLSLMNKAIQGSQLSLMKLQEDFRKLDKMVSRHETIILGIQEGMESSLRKVDSVLEEVDKKMEEFQDWVNYVKPTDRTTKIPMEIMNS